jgi:hypothetical protein
VISEAVNSKVVYLLYLCHLDFIDEWSIATLGPDSRSDLIISKLFGFICSVESGDGTGIAIAEEAIISLYIVEELDRSTQ